jgi:hypothetical protein
VGDVRYFNEVLKSGVVDRCVDLDDDDEEEDSWNFDRVFERSVDPEASLMIDDDEEDFISENEKVATCFLGNDDDEEDFISKEACSFFGNAGNVGFFSEDGKETSCFFGKGDDREDFFSHEGKEAGCLDDDEEDFFSEDEKEASCFFGKDDKEDDEREVGRIFFFEREPDRIFNEDNDASANAST